MRKIAVAAAAAVCLLLADAAAADVGVEKADRGAGRPGTRVHLTLACGFCFPPCVGPRGERHPEGFERGPCMLGERRQPPASFGVSLLPRRRAERLLACEAGGEGCPTPERAPRRWPFHYVGEAVPPPGGNDPEAGELPRYLLEFEVPALAPGEYTYVIWCDACRYGRAGSLVLDPRADAARLTVRPARGTAEPRPAVKPAGIKPATEEVSDG